MDQSLDENISGLGADKNIPDGMLSSRSESARDFNKIGGEIEEEKKSSMLVPANASQKKLLNVMENTTRSMPEHGDHRQVKEELKSSIGPMTSQKN